MAWTTPGTATAGEVLTASFWNTNVRDNLNMIGTWTTFTPSYTGVTIGNGTNQGAYIQAGKTVAFWAKFTLGSTSAITATPVLTLPVNAKSDAIGSYTCLFIDAGTNYYISTPRHAGSTLELYATVTSGAYASIAQVTATIPFTWTTSDVIQVGGIYETV